MAKIMIIDDDARMRRTVMRILRSGGHEVTQAEDGAQGFQLVRTDCPDIVVTDIVMPEKEGIETILDLRREYPNLLIVAISGGTAGSTTYLRFAQRLWANATLAKPFRSEDLLREVEKLLPR